jgi:hypothetical protein
MMKLFLVYYIYFNASETNFPVENSIFSSIYERFKHKHVGLTRFSSMIFVIHVVHKYELRSRVESNELNIWFFVVFQVSHIYTHNLFEI